MTKNTNWTPETLPKAQSDTRTAAAVWISALKLDLDPLTKYSEKAGIKTSADEDLKRTVKKCFPDADIDMAQKLVKHAAPYENITDELLDEIIATTHTDGYEIIQWREIVLRVLAMDLLTALKSSSPQLIEDAVQRVTAITDEKLRGTTKNACQFISGQRTRIRKMVRMLTVAMLYHRKYRIEMTLESMQNDVMQLVKPCPDTDFVRDDFPFDDFLAANKEINARGRFAFCEAVNAVNEIQSKLAEIDEIIQNSSKRWRVSRMDLNDLNILRLAAYELCFERISTPRILINEAVELAKLFGAEQSKNFVNGILQQLCNDRNIEVV